ncbi:hypothetical protein [Psychrilyobacter atlanticus]|uniref:hypothetical protein n=1 Tax=Psychrilyobacter atlanticus TaxID=271091 RepID=UPI00041CAA88|nr:hypothetical protein [Psychrilyobacter atlanticus]
MLNRDKLERIGIDKLVLSGIKIETDKKSLFTEGQGWIEEKFEIKEELFSIEKTIKLYDSGEVRETTYLRFNPNKILHGHNIYNTRNFELKESINRLISLLNSKDISIDLSEAKISEIEININLDLIFEEFKEVFILLFLKLPKLRKIGNINLNESYKKLFVDSTLDGGWKSHKVRIYDKKREVDDKTLLNFELTRLEWWLSSSTYKYYATERFNIDNTLEALLGDQDLLDKIFMELCREKLFKEAYRYLEKELVPNLELNYLELKKQNKLARSKGRSPKRSVYKYLEDNSWIFDYSNLIDIVNIHNKKNRGREIKRINSKYSHLNNKEKLSYLVGKIFPH